MDRGRTRQSRETARGSAKLVARNAPARNLWLRKFVSFQRAVSKQRKPAWWLTRRGIRLFDHHNVMRPHEAEHAARLLVEHVGVEPVTAQQRDMALEPRALGGDDGEARLGAGDLLADGEPGEDAAITLHHVRQEVPDDENARGRTGHVARLTADFVEQPHDVTESQRESGGQASNR